jgi:hypothetical protein
MLPGVDEPVLPVPRGLTSDVAGDWVQLAAAPGDDRVFGAALVAELPEPVRRWLGHAIAAGTPLARSVFLRTSGEIRLGRWAAFDAVQRSSVDGGFVWAATARPLGLPVVGFDRWTRGSGQMRWRLFGAVPVMTAQGEDVTRSAAGRHAGELLLALPTAALAPEVAWAPLDTDRAVASVTLGGARTEVTVTIGPDGALRELVMPRWGAIGSGSFGEQVFGATTDGEVTARGVTVPRRVTAGWHYGSDRWATGQFIRYTVEEVAPG